MDVRSGKWIALALVVVSSVTLAARALVQGGRTATDPVVRTSSRGTEAGPVAPARDLEAGEHRQALGTPATAPRPGPQRFTVLGRVLDGHGRAVPGLRVVPEEPDGRRPGQVFADDGGAFRLRLPRAERRRWIVEDEEWITVRALMPVEGRAEAENRIVVAPARELVVTVVSSVDGQPLEGAQVELVLDVDRLPGFRTAWLGTGRVEFRSRTGADGSTVLARAPRTPGTRLLVSRAGWSSSEIALSAESDAVTAELTPPEKIRPTVDDAVVATPTEKYVAGRLLDERGVPKKGWQVVLLPLEGAPVAPERVRTDRDGRFVLATTRPGLHVVRAFGRLPGEEVDSDPLEPPIDDLALRLTTPLARGPIHGRVLDADGLPVPGALVGVARASAARPTAERELWPRPRATTGPDGSFFLREVPAGRLRLTALSDDLEPLLHVVAAEATPVEVELRGRRRPPVPDRAPR